MSPAACRTALCVETRWPQQQDGRPHVQRRRRSPGSGRHEPPQGPAAEPTLRDRPVPSSRSCVDGVFPAMPRFPRGLRGRLLFTRGTTGRAIRRPGPPGSAVPTAPSSELQGVGRRRRLPRSPGPGGHGRLCRPPPACCPWPSGFLSPACQAQAPQVTPRAFPCPARCRPDFSAPPAHPAAWLSTGAQAKRGTAADGQSKCSSSGFPQAVPP